MSIFADFDKMHIDLKGSILCIAIQLPFWYISLFIFNYDLYYRADYILLIALCLGLSMVSYIVQFFVEIIISHAILRAFDQDKKVGHKADIMTWAMLWFIFYFTNSFLVCYTIKYFLEIHYIVFLGLFFLLILIGSYFRTKKQLKKVVTAAVNNQ